LIHPYQHKEIKIDILLIQGIVKLRLQAKSFFFQVFGFKNISDFSIQLFKEKEVSASIEYSAPL